MRGVPRYTTFLPLAGEFMMRCLLFHCFSIVARSCVVFGQGHVMQSAKGKPALLPVCLKKWHILWVCLGLLQPLAAHALEDAVLAVEAAQYQQLITNKRSVSGKSTALPGQRAKQQSRQKNWSAAIESYETAIASGDATAALWLSLSRAWHMLASQNKTGWQTRYHARQRSRQAAWKVLDLAKSPHERARALLWLGQLYDQGGSPKKAMAAYREGLALEDHPKIAKRYQQLDKAHAFRITGVEVESNSATPKVCLKFSGSLAKSRQQLHYEDYIQIQPAIQFAITVRGQQLCVEGISHGQHYTLTVRAGIPSATGEKTRVKQNFTAKVEDREPTLGFRGTTYVLPRIGARHLPLISVNLETARLRVLRINDRNLMREIEKHRITRVLDGHDLQQIATRSGEQVWEGILTLATGSRNQEITTAIPISTILSDPRPGIYIVAAERADKTPGRYTNRATQWLVVSDIGLFTMRGADGLHVFARSLATAQPLADIRLKLYARNNSELGEVATDEKGYARLDPGLLRGEGGREPAALMAFANDDYNVIDLTRPAFDLSDRGVEGRMAPGAVDVFLYTERGVYRPGETVELMALLRDNRANALPNAPLTLKVFRPDTVEAARLQPKTAVIGGYHARLPLPRNARTGTWTVKAYTDPKGKSFGQMSFQVEDFVPQRLKLELKAATKTLKPNVPTTLAIHGRFLYGAPAANLKAEAEVVLREDPKPYPQYADYHFGLIQDEWTAKRFPVALAGTDAQGQAQTVLMVNETPDTTRPLLARLRVSLFEPGGRPVHRHLDLPYRIQPFAIGIKPHFSGGIQSGQEAGFDVIALDPSGQRYAGRDLRVDWIREEYQYYWYHNNSRWNYKQIIRDRAPVSSQTLSLTSGQVATIRQNGLDWGHYRLEIVDPQTGVASSVRFTVGWFEKSGVGDTPDQMKVTLDKPHYQAGDTARVFIRAPFAGEVVLNVMGDRLWLSKAMSVPADGMTVTLPIAAEWGPGVYIAATAFRPADHKAQRGPGRAVGVAWAGLDPAQRRLNIALDIPREWKPRQKVNVPVTVTGIDASQPAYLTLAAVDEGILQLTDFATPNPVEYFLGKRQLAMQLRDIYGQLIEIGGRPGALKVGGGAGRRHLNPSGVRTVKTVALFSGPVALDGKGQAQIPLELPDFNGQLRLMAVAWDQQRVGSAEAELFVRDPLVARVYLPRFLAPKDESHITVTVQNLTAPTGDYQLRLVAEGAVAISDTAELSFKMTDSTGQRQKSHTFTLRGLQPGSGKVRLHLAGPGDFQLVRESEIAVRPVQPVISTRVARRLHPAEPLHLGHELLADYFPDTSHARLSISSRPDLNVPELLARLDRYPYGCLEQTVSRALPLLYFNAVAQVWSHKATETGLRARVQQAIQNILSLQDASGGFGLWNPGDSVDNWLSAYAMDFLVRARNENYLVPETAYQSGLRYLQGQVAGDAFKEKQLGWYTYSLYVLASVQKASIGNLRYLHDNYLQKLPTALAQAQLGASLARYGEVQRAKEAFNAALNRSDRTAVVHDYGSELRDRAALLALQTEAGMLPARIPPLADQVVTDFNTRRYTSTQEQVWLLLAAHALQKQSGSLQLTVEGQPVKADPFYRSLNVEQLTRGLTVINQGKQPVWYTLSLSGVPVAARPPEQKGFNISRQYYTRTGKPVDPAQLRQNQLLVAVITGQTQSRTQQQALVVDLLPAGLEIENVRLVRGASGEDFAWLPTLTSTVHTEFRDDRFVAALNLGEDSKKQSFTLAYLVRAVTPGIYQQPAVYIEDMYKPWQFGRGSVGTVKVE